MARDEKDPECRAILVHETADAIQVRAVGSAHGHETWWVPKSQIGYRRTERGATPGGLDLVIFTLPEWLVEKKQMWVLV